VNRRTLKNQIVLKILLYIFVMNSVITANATPPNEKIEGSRSEYIVNIVPRDNPPKRAVKNLKHI
jgi:hypothetical protein